MAPCEHAQWTLNRAPVYKSQKVWKAQMLCSNIASRASCPGLTLDPCNLYHKALELTSPSTSQEKKSSLHTQQRHSNEMDMAPLPHLSESRRQDRYTFYVDRRLHVHEGQRHKLGDASRPLLQ